MRIGKLLISLIVLMPVGCVADFDKEHLEIPSAPVGLDAVAISPTAIRLSWIDTSEIETGYVVECRKATDVQFELLALVDASVQSYNVESLTSETLFIFRVKATGRAGDSGYTSDASATTQSSTELTTLRLDAGLLSGTAMYEDKVFVPMVGYSEEPLDTSSRDSRPIYGTLNDDLYLTELYRIGDMTFSFPVNNGDYTVHIHNAETTSGATSVGYRLFSIDINGIRRMTDWDIYAVSGFDTAAIKSFDVNVSDSLLVISFIQNQGFDNPKVCGLEILPQGEASLTTAD